MTNPTLTTTTQEACSLLQVSVSRLGHLRKSCQLTWEKRGRKVFYNEEQIKGLALRRTLARLGEKHLAWPNNIWAYGAKLIACPHEDCRQRAAWWKMETVCQVGHTNLPTW